MPFRLLNVPTSENQGADGEIECLRLRGVCA